MYRIRSFMIRTLNLFRRPRLERDLREQIDTHRAMIRDDLVQRGMEPSKAAAAAKRALGNDLLVREFSGDEMGHRRIEEFRQDLRYALRGLAWDPRFTIVAVITLALGIGVNIAVFSAVDRVLFRSLPYADPDSLFVMTEHAVDDDQPFGTLPASYVVEARRAHQGFVDLSVTTSFGPVPYALTPDPDAPPAVSLVGVSFNMLKLLGVTPVVGRDFTEEDARQGRSLILIGYEAWKAGLDGDPGVIGRELWTSNRQRAEIIGVLPRGFLPPPSISGRWADGLALSSNPLDTARSGDRSLPAYVRLKPGVTVAAAEAELNAIAAQVKQAEPPPRPGARPTILRLTAIRTAVFRQFRAYSWLVAGAAALVLLVTCANLASLLLVRGRSREHMTAMRVALGASSGRLVRSVLTESLSLAAAGALVALLVLAWSGNALQLLQPAMSDQYAAPVLDLRVLGLSLLAACGSAGVASVLPSLRLRRIDVARSLQGTGDGTGPRRLRGGASLLAIEAAIGVVLATGAVATSRSLIGLLRTDLGFDPAHLYQVSVLFPPGPDSESRFQQYQRTLGILRGLPAVRSVAGANVLPTIIGAAGWTQFGKGYEGRGYRWHVTDDYFETLKQPVLAGRTISAADVSGRVRVGVLGLSGLNLVWPGVAPADALGRELRFPGEQPIRVIGVVSDLRSAYSYAPDAALYMPIVPDVMRSMLYAVRMEPGHVIAARDIRERLRREVAEASSLTVSRVSDGIDRTLREPRFRAALFGLFGVLALLSAAVGLYGVCSFEVALRRREMGIRLALGGSEADLQRLVIGHAIRPVLLGVAAGLVPAYWAAKFLQSFLHKVDARDPWTFGLVAVVLILTAFVAAWLPARRVSRVDPARILRAV